MYAVLMGRFFIAVSENDNGLYKWLVYLVNDVLPFVTVDDVLQ